jgi:uncharacterized damage-inducible protein DinB
MRTLRPLLAVLLLLGAPAIAQAQDESVAVNTSRQLWEQLIGYIIASAEDVPEATYAFRPTPEVRSLGQLFAHVAGAQYLICGAAMGEPPSDENNIEKTRTSKADIVAALKASTEYCARAYQQTDKAASRPRPCSASGRQGSTP